MPQNHTNRLRRPETLTALGILVVAAVFLIPTFALKPISALLPAAMLIGLMLLSAFLLVGDQRKAAAGEAPVQMMQSPRRVGGAFALIIAYALAVDFIGFYLSTAVSVPLVAWIFGYRSPAGLAIAACVVLAAIWLVFDFGMSQSFPSGRLWQM